MNIKKVYFPATMTVVELQQKYHLLAGSFNNIGGNADLDYDGGGSGGSTTPAMGREIDDF